MATTPAVPLYKVLAWFVLARRGYKAGYTITSTDMAIWEGTMTKAAILTELLQLTSKGKIDPIPAPKAPLMSAQAPVEPVLAHAPAVVQS